MTTLTGYATLQGSLISKDVTVSFRERTAGGFTVLDATSDRALGVIVPTADGFIAAPSANAFKMDADDVVPMHLIDRLPQLFVTVEHAAANLVSTLLTRQSPAFGFDAHLDVVPAAEAANYAF